MKYSFNMACLPTCKILTKNFTIKYLCNMLCLHTCRILERAHFQSGDIDTDKKEQRFEKINLYKQDASWREKVDICFCLM